MQKIHPFYSNSADPSDGNSNHWMNAPDIKLEDGQCPECFSLDTFTTPKLKTAYCCKKCFTKFD